MPSFARMFARWRSTVLALITSRSAISFVELPSAISFTISSSRGVRMRSGTLSRRRWSRMSAVTAAG
jgi:hypothetical protein